MAKTSQIPAKPATKPTPAKRSTKADLARAWNINTGLVSRLFALPGAPAFQKGRIATGTAEAWRATVNATRQADASEKGHWRKELDRLRCVQLSQEIDVDAGKLIPADDVRQVAQADAAMIKTAMLGMANALAPQMLGLATPEQARAILDDWARSTLTAWACACGYPGTREALAKP